METGNPAEHRMVKRIPGDTVGPLRLRLESFTGPLLAKVRNVSIQGVAFLMNECFAQGTCFKVESGPSGKEFSAELTATVHHATMQPDGQWLLGCGFSRFLTGEDFEALS